ncbi:MAG: hypothetical protein V8S85_05400 [Oscillospiraceae bacterium]
MAEYSSSFFSEIGFSNAGKSNAKIINKLRIESIRFETAAVREKISAKSHWQTFVLVLSYGTWQEILPATEYSEAHHKT